VIICCGHLLTWSLALLSLVDCCVCCFSCICELLLVLVCVLNRISGLWDQLLYSWVLPIIVVVHAIVVVGSFALPWLLVHGIAVMRSCNCSPMFVAS